MVIFRSVIIDKAHQVTFRRRYLNAPMIEVYTLLNGNSPDIMNDIFRLKENMYNFWNFHILQTENPRSLKCGLDAFPYPASQLWQQVPIDVYDTASLAPFKNRIKTTKCEDCHVDLVRYLFKMSDISH